MAEVPVKQVVEDLLTRVKAIEASDTEYTKDLENLTNSLSELTSTVSSLSSDISSINNNITSINQTLDDYHDLLYMEVD